MPAKKQEEFTIRLASRGDAPAIISLVNTAFTVEDFLEGTRTDAERMAKTMDTGQFIVAENLAGQMVAAVYIAIKNSRGYFGMLAVAPSLQGRGLGRRMIEAAENHCRNLGCDFMDIKVLSLRTTLPSYYRQFGYEITGTEVFRPSRPLKPGVECHCIVMTKRLAAS